MSSFNNSGITRKYQECITDVEISVLDKVKFDELMGVYDIVKFVENSPNKVFANHLEAVNHCPTTRDKLKQILKKEGLFDKVYIPNDGGAFEV